MKYIIIVLFLTGCTIDGGEIAKEDLNKRMLCTDTRDGETFSYYGRDVSNIRSGSNPSIDIVDNKGRHRTLTNQMQNTFLKCWFE